MRQDTEPPPGARRPATIGGVAECFGLRYDLDLVDGLGPDFDRDRELLRQRRPSDAEKIFDEFCKALGQTDSWSQLSPNEIAIKAIRALAINLLAAGM
jgi:hypothetical protein